MKQLFYAVLLTALLTGWGTSAGAQQDNTNIAHLRPRAVAPPMKAPTLDGVISPSEWPTLHVGRFVSQGVDTLSARAGEFWIGGDEKHLYIAVRSAVHPIAGALKKVEFDPTRDNSEVVLDDSIELWIDSDPVAQRGPFFQIALNPNGARFDQRTDRATKEAQTYWNADLKQAHKIEGNIWTAEVAIPLASVSITDATAPLGYRIARNYKFGWDQARSEPLVRGFDTPENMSVLRLQEGAPIVSEAGLQDENGIAIGVDVTNPGAAPLSVTVKIGYNAQDQPRYFQNWNETLKAGETKRFTYNKELFTSENYPAIGEITVSGAPDTVFYQRDFKWQTKPPAAQIWQAVAASAPDAARFDIAYYPSYHLLRWRTDFAALKDRDKVARARVEIFAPGATKPVATGALAQFKEFAGEARVALPPLKDGRYEARFSLDGAGDGKPLKTVSFLQRSDFPWLNNRIGLGAQVVAPFTPITVEKNRVSTVLREHAMSSVGLWSQVTARGETVLAAPMRLEAGANGGVREAKGQLRLMEKQPNRVLTVAEWSEKGSGLRGRTTSEWDYDGMMKVQIDLAPTQKVVDSLEIVIPLRDDQATLMHASGEGLRTNYGGEVPKGDGEVWNSREASRQRLIGTFLPYLWVGDEERGLCWFAGNDRDWIVDDSGQKPALSIERRNGVLNLRVRLIQKPARLTRAHRITFGLLATPVKPMPQGWRRWGFASGGETEFQTLGMSQYWGADLYSTFPRGRDYSIMEAVAKAAKEGKSDRAFFDQWLAKNPDMAGEINYTANNPQRYAGLIPYTNLRGEITSTDEWAVYQDEWRRQYFPDERWSEPVPGSIDFATIPTRSRQDYLLWNYRKILQAGFDGIYWDNIAIYDNENPVTGDGYFRDDGRFQTDTDIWEMRQITRRTALLFDELGKRNLGEAHMTNAYLLPVFGWSAISLGWEWRYGGTDFQDRFTRPYIRAINIGRQGGNVPVVLGGITEVTDPAKVQWIERTRIAATFPHELNVWQADGLHQRIKGHLMSIGYGTEAARVFNYWDKNPVLKIEGLDAAWLVVQGRDEIAVFLGDYGDGGAARVTLDGKRLGLPDDFVATDWENPDAKYAAVGGALSLPELKKHDFQMLVIARPKS